MLCLAALAALAAIPVHLYWALGGTWGLPGTAAASLPAIRAANIAVSVLLACGAAFLYGLTRPWSRRPPALRDLAVFEPWFVIQGLLLALAGRWLARTPTGCRRWTLSLSAGIVLVDAFGIALAATHHHFAVSLPAH